MSEVHQKSREQYRSCSRNGEAHPGTVAREIKKGNKDCGL